MSDQTTTAPSYTTTFAAPVTPDQAFAAAADPRSWWVAMIEGSAEGVGDRFVVDVPGLHHAELVVTAAEPGRHLAWTVQRSGAEHEIEDWVGTVITFDVAATGDGSEITFTHHGLHPALECHEVCSTAWTHHLDMGLRALLTDGAGAPITPESVDAVAEQVGATRS